MSDQTIINLETALAHLEKTVAELSDVIRNQWNEIDRLKQQLSKTNHKLDDLESSIGGEDQANVKPPHW
tara:strand:+ start:139 stop:345 length:207 start_codon:yes stop_codon:yes gene_type:complete